ncbi:CD209 antigen-like protein C isoform X1 [Oreochromis niloticus]|uniref:CD209 antigen-like protein C isoform X1 n=1 Tax=Oreochromis niloticus TaxID=8128 RepID=UPI000DF2151B|nr:CD209 antigen-like protein C isoform X1 [Oreochromis niloticus]
MSSDICGEPDLSKKVRYSRKEQEDRGEWEQREVDIYESTDDIRDNDTNFQAHEGGPQTQSPPSVQKGSFRCATLALRVLCLLMLAGIIILSICFGWNKSEYDKLHNSYIQFLDKVLDNMSQLQSSYDTLSQNNSDIQEEVKKLKEKIKDVTGNMTQLQSSYDKLSKNHSELQEEVKKLKEKIEGKWCPEGWRRFGCSCYFKSTESKTWSESRRDCWYKGADLVMINSKEEQEFVNEFGGFFWIGLRAKQTSGGSKWEWVDGSALTETFWAEGHGNPSSGSRGVCCDDSGRWTGSHYSESKTFICEK